MTTVFERLGAIPTTAQIDQEVQLLNDEVAQIDSRRAEIDAQMTENWGNDDTEALNEAVRLTHRRNAADGVFTRLAELRKEAARREVVEQYRQALTAQLEAWNDSVKADTELVKAFDKVQAVFDKTEDRNRRFFDTQNAVKQVLRDCQHLGCADLDEIASQFSLPDSGLDPERLRYIQTVLSATHYDIPAFVQNQWR